MSKPRACSACGELFAGDERFCENCGAALPALAPVARPSSAFEELIAGRYKLVREAGKGGMGTVFLAHDKVLRRDVALKVLHPNLSNRKSAPKRLLREARAAGRINHPNVVQIYDAGVLESDERPFLVMEFLEGQTLKELFEARQGLPWNELYPLTRQILSGLAAAHAKEVIHRDLKPGNIFIAPDPAGDRIKLVDFGLSKILDAGSSTRLTEDGAILGTPLYMAPEQVRGEVASSLSDIFSVGVLLYRGLTGHFPFHGVNAVDLYRNILKGAPPPLRQKAPERDISPGLEAIVLRALSMDPAKRPQSAAALLHLLDESVRQESNRERFLPASLGEIPIAVVYERKATLNDTEATSVSEAPEAVQSPPPEAPALPADAPQLRPYKPPPRPPSEPSLSTPGALGTSRDPTKPTPNPDFYHPSEKRAPLQRPQASPSSEQQGRLVLKPRSSPSSSQPAAPAVLRPAPMPRPSAPVPAASAGEAEAKAESGPLWPQLHQRPIGNDPTAPHARAPQSAPTPPPEIHKRQAREMAPVPSAPRQDAPAAKPPNMTQLPTAFFTPLEKTPLPSSPARPAREMKVVPKKKDEK
jgi:serine/threonine-protein kinase